jgi:hypothetical protein
VDDHAVLRRGYGDCNGGVPVMSKKKLKHNIYRDGKIHVLSEMCATCIFNPKTRPVGGARVAGMVRGTKDTEGATVPCHNTLYGPKPKRNAICRGWYDRLGDRDIILKLAEALDIIHFQDGEGKE